MSEQTGPDDEQGRNGEDPRDIGMELLRHLGTLDDRLQRSQAQMFDLLDRQRAHTGAHQPPTLISEPPAVTTGPPTVTAELDEDLRILGGEDDPDSAPTSGKVMPGNGAGAPEPPLAGAEQPPPASAASTPAPVRSPKLRRPTWQSNLITAVIAVAVLLVGLAFVGAL